VSSLTWDVLGHVLKLGARDVTATPRLVEVHPAPTDLAQVMDRVDALARPLSWAYLQILRARTRENHGRSRINPTLKCDWTVHDLCNRVGRLPDHDHGLNP
jgi:hypothetical protein